MFINTAPYLNIVESLKSNLNQADFIAKITGPEASGVTTVLKEFKHYLDQQDYCSVMLTETFESVDKLRNKLEKRLSIAESHNFSGRLQEVLEEKVKTHKGVVFIFDNCGALSTEVLAEVYRLTQLQLDDNRLLSIVLGGNSLLDDKLRKSKELAELRVRISTSLSVPLLNRDTLPTFLLAYFTAEKKMAPQFESSAIAEIVTVSAGRPQLALDIVNSLDQTLGGTEASAPFTKADVRALGKQDLGAEFVAPRTFSRFAAFTIGGCAAVVVLVVGIVLTNQTSQNDTQTQSDMASMQATQLPSNPAPSPFLDQTELASPEESPEEASELAASLAVVNAMIEEVPEPLVLASTPAASNTSIENAPSTPPTIVEPVVAPEPEPEPNVAVTSSSYDIEATTDINASAAAQPQSESTSDTNADSQQVIADEIEVALSRWTQAWQKQDVQTYLARYHVTFQPATADSIENWRTERRRNIENKAWIQLQLSQLEFIDIYDGVAEVSFWLGYASPGYADDTHKKVWLKQDKNDWLIQGEVNLEVVRRPN